MHAEIPDLTDDQIAELLATASASPRRRIARVLHSPGDEFNRVFNVMMHDSYMQPHHHPGPEKIEHIHLIRGEIVIVFFDERGGIDSLTRLGPRGVKSVTVPAFTWHTYAIMSDHAITYETMMGVYDPRTWKTMGGWAPAEQTDEAGVYLNALKQQARVAAS